MEKSEEMGGAHHRQNLSPQPCAAGADRRGGIAGLQLHYLDN